MRMKFLRTFPEICARTSCPFGSDTRNIVPGSTCVTVPVSSIGSSFATRIISCRKPRCRQPLKCAPTFAVGTTSASVSRRSGQLTARVSNTGRLFAIQAQVSSWSGRFPLCPLTDRFGRRDLRWRPGASARQLRFQTCRTEKRFHDIRMTGCQKQNGQAPRPISRVGRNAMKSGSFSAVLAGVLVVAAFAAAWQVSRLYFATRQLRGLQPSVMDANNRLNLAQALLNDTLEYSKRNPSIDPLL